MKPIPMRKESILPRVDGITRNIEKLKRLATQPVAEFEKRDDVFDLAQHHLRLALEGIFHIGSHILARVPGARITSYKDIAVRLGEVGVVEKQFAKERLGAMAGYRTRLTHFYHDITAKELYEILQTRLPDIESFLASVKRVLEKPEAFGLTVE